MKKAKRSPLAGRRNGVQSIEVGWLLLEALANSTGPQPLSELAGAANMAASKARRYLISLQRCGLVDQDRTTSRYDLGPMAVHVGLSALNRTNPIRFGTEAVLDLNQTLDRTTLLTVWSERGPIVIAWYDASETLICNLYVGSILPLLRSISGRLFLSYLPRPTTKALLRRELDSEYVQNDLNIKSERDVGRLITDIRGRGLSYAAELLVPGLGAVGAPIFDHEGRIVATIGIVGLPGTLELTGSGSDGEAVTKKAAEVSRRLGYRGANQKGSLIEWIEAKQAGRSVGNPPALSSARSDDDRK
jgi:DNA-binding IclR family transcriptional regulator